MSSGRVGKAIVLTCFIYGRLRPAQEIGDGFSHPVSAIGFENFAGIRSGPVDVSDRRCFNSCRTS